MTLRSFGFAGYFLFLACILLAPAASKAQDADAAQGTAPDGDGAGTQVEAPSVPAEQPSAPSPEESEALADDSITPEVTAASDTDTSGTLALLRNIEKRHAGANTVEGTFRQTKVSEIFLEEIESTGKFWYRKPDFFRCDYNPPDEMTNLIVEDKIYVHVPSIQQVEVYRFASPDERDQQLHSMVLGFGFEAEQILEQYAVRSSEDEASLIDELTAEEIDSVKVALFQFTPKGALIETSPFVSLKLWIDKETLLPQKIWFEDYNGDKTTLRIVEIGLNVSLDDSLFSPTFPPGTEYIDKTEEF